MWLNKYSIEHADVTGNDKLGRKRKKAKKMYEEALKEGRVFEPSNIGRFGPLISVFGKTITKEDFCSRKLEEINSWDIVRLIRQEVTHFKNEFLDEMCDDRNSHYETPFQICIFPDTNYFPEAHLPYFTLGFIAVNPDDETNCWVPDDFQKYPIYNGLGRNTVYYSELDKGFEAVRLQPMFHTLCIGRFDGRNHPGGPQQPFDKYTDVYHIEYEYEKGYIKSATNNLLNDSNATCTYSTDRLFHDIMFELYNFIIEFKAFGILNKKGWIYNNLFTQKQKDVCEEMTTEAMAPAEIFTYIASKYWDPSMDFVNYRRVTYELPCLDEDEEPLEFVSFYDKRGQKDVVFNGKHYPIYKVTEKVIDEEYKNLMEKVQDYIDFEAVRMTNQIKEMNKWLEEHKREPIKI